MFCSDFVPPFLFPKQRDTDASEAQNGDWDLAFPGWRGSVKNILSNFLQPLRSVHWLRLSEYFTEWTDRLHGVVGITDAFWGNVCIFQVISCFSISLLKLQFCYIYIYKYIYIYINLMLRKSKFGHFLLWYLFSSTKFYCGPFWHTCSP